MMNEEAEKIYQKIRAILRERGSRDITKPVEMKWHGLICVHYPTSNGFTWWPVGAPRDITRKLRKGQVISLINIELVEQMNEA